MQTFLPSQDYDECADVLDFQRLGKQRVECLQILKAIIMGVGWTNHPATQMWRPYIPHLCLYSRAMCLEWRKRGGSDNLLPLFDRALDICEDCPNIPDGPPDWLVTPLFNSHRSQLLGKDPDHYRKHWPDHPIAPASAKYWWPTNHGFFCLPIYYEYREPLRVLFTTNR